jgi:hypothetical protein
MAPPYLNNFVCSTCEPRGLPTIPIFLTHRKKERRRSGVMMIARRRPAGVPVITVAPLMLAVLLVMESSRSQSSPLLCTAFAPSAIARRLVQRVDNFPGLNDDQATQQQQQHQKASKNSALRRQLLILNATRRRDNNNNQNRNSNKPSGVYSRPSAAIEKGSGKAYSHPLLPDSACACSLFMCLTHNELFILSFPPDPILCTYPLP